MIDFSYLYMSLIEGMTKKSIRIYNDRQVRAYLKGKMANEDIELVSVTNQFKFEAPDGKQRASDALDAECVQTLAKHYPLCTHR